MENLLEKKRPIVEPYDEDVRVWLQAEWEKEKDRLMESDVTVPRNAEPFARRIFFDGYVAALNTPPF